MAMYFVQHGLCVAKEIDPEQPLSDAGRKEVERVAIHLRKAGVAVGRIFHSGKTRARQTAELLAEQVGSDHIDERAGMKPNDDVVEFVATLEDDAMYVGHLPHLAKLVSYLAAGDEAGEVVRFSNGGVVCIGKDDAGYYVEWFVRQAKPI